MGSRHGHNVELMPLDIKVKVATMQAELVPEIFHPLLKLLFFSPHKSNVDSSWRQVCLADGRLSIIAKQEELDVLPNFTVDPTDWSVVQVSEGQHGFDSVGVVERVTGPLAAANVPVLYISTYQTDYVLVPSEQLDAALAQFEIVDAQSMRSNSGASLEANETQREESFGGEATCQSVVAKTDAHPLAVLEDAASHIFSIACSALESHTGALIRLLFMPLPGDAPHALISLTETAEEVSLLCGHATWFFDYASRAEGIRMGGSSAWIPIRIGPEAGTPLEEIGLIATHANVLMSASIPILYNSTCAADYALVPDNELDSAMNAFAVSGFDVSMTSTWRELASSRRRI